MFCGIYIINILGGLNNERIGVIISVTLHFTQNMTIIEIWHSQRLIFFAKVAVYSKKTDEKNLT